MSTILAINPCMRPLAPCLLLACLAIPCGARAIERPTSWRLDRTGVKKSRQPAAPLPPEDPADRAVRWRDKPFGLVLRGSLMTDPFLSYGPPGLVGLRLSFSPVPYVGFEAGAGLVPGSGSLLVFGRLPVSHGLAFTLGLGHIWTFGTFKQFDPAADHAIHVYDSPRWVTWGLGLEHRSRGGWIFRTDLEFFTLQSPHDFDCQNASGSGREVRPCSEEEDAASNVYWDQGTGLAFSLGHAF